MPTVRVGDLDIWYERSQGDGPLVVLTHGFAGPSSAGWPPIVTEFKRRFDVLIYDVRAHGKTRTVGAPSGTHPTADNIEADIAALGTVTMPQFAADLAGLLDALGIRRAHMAGVSMGGMITAQFACDHPERLKSVWLCDTVAGNRQGTDEAATEVERTVVNAFERMEAIVKKYGMQGLVDRENRYRHETDPYAHLQTLTVDEQDEDNRRKKMEHMTAAGFIASNRAIRTRPDLTSRTPAIAVPTLVSCGEWDLFYPSAVRDHSLIPGSRFVTVRKAAHDTVAYRPERWLEAGTDFVNDVEASRNTAGEFVLS